MDFENLSDEDLGLLLLTLQPNLLGEGIPSDRLYHHFGMGKPLGLGSAKVTITGLTTYNRVERYQGLTADGKAIDVQADKQAEIPAKVKTFVDAFVKEALKEPSLSSGTDADGKKFAGMKHVKALLIMLDYKNAPKPVKYPPGDTDSNSKQYWESFKHLLHTPQEVKNGVRQPLTPPRQNQGYSRRGGRHRQRGRRR